MARPLSFMLFEVDGVTPKTNAAPTLNGAIYRSLALVDRQPPVILNLGLGKYGLQPSAADEAEGIVWMTALIPGAFPAYAFGAACPLSAPIAAVAFFDSLGAKWAGANPTLTWLDPTGAAPASPGLVTIDGHCLFAIKPTAADLLAGRHWRVPPPALALPVRGYDGDFSFDTAAPSVTLIDPVAPGIILPGAQLLFNVTDNVALRKAMVMVKLTSGWEVVHDGDDFGPNYASSSSRAIISGGFQYTTLRVGGWPSGAVSLKVIPIDTSGNEGI